MDFTAKDAAVYNNENNKAQKSEPKTDLSLIKSHVFNKLLSLPLADAAFPDVALTPLSPEVFQDVTKFPETANYLTEAKYNELNGLYKSTLTEDDYDDDINCPLCVTNLWSVNPKKPVPFPEDIVDLLCGHPAHLECLQHTLVSVELGGSRGRCGKCTKPFFYTPGEQPQEVVATVSYDATPLPGFESNGTVVLTFDLSQVKEQCAQKEYKFFFPATPITLQGIVRLFIKTFLLGLLFPFYKDDGETKSVGLASGLHTGYPNETYATEIVAQFEALGIQLSADELAIE